MTLAQFKQRNAERRERIMSLDPAIRLVVEKRIPSGEKEEAA